MLHFEDFEVGSVSVGPSRIVAREEIVAFARRFDPQDFHLDEELARPSFVGELIASGWHSCALLMRLISENFILDSASMGSPGVEQVRWLRPLRPGDAVSLRRTVLAKRESRSRPGMGLVHFRFELLNQDREPVAEQGNWIMFGRAGTPFSAEAGDWLAHPPLYVPPVPQQPLDLADGAAEPAAFFEDTEVGSGAAMGGFTFTPEEIVAFARSFDPQPFHMDAGAAARSSFGALCASGWHTAAVWMALMIETRRRQLAAVGGGPAPRMGPSPGFRNLRWSSPVYAGDTVRYAYAVTDKRASATRPRWGLVFQRNTGVNQNGDEVFSFDGCVFIERRS